jgi:hypothetical protein
VTIPENVILVDGRISAKKIAETLAISQESHNILDMRNLSAN